VTQPAYRYGVYGVTVTSDTPLPLPPPPDLTLAAIEYHAGDEALFADGRARASGDRSSWQRLAALPDGSTYVAWPQVGEFLVPADGRSIRCRPADEATRESFNVYLLGQALSLALVNRGLEPLHGTAVVLDDGTAVAFLGANGAGKSTLAAAFLKAGASLLTDDLLLIELRDGGPVAHPGPPRIKLFPQMATRVLGDSASAGRMNPETAKLIVPIEPSRHVRTAATLRAIYAIAPPEVSGRRPHVGIEALGRRAAFVELVRATFNRQVVTRQRLERQLNAMTALAGAATVKRLTYPRRIDDLSRLRDAVLTDATRTSAAARCSAETPA
jgi:hypothetical protein